MKTIIFYSSLVVLLTMHVIGLYGILNQDNSFQTYVLNLTPIHLLVTTVCLLINQQSIQSKSIVLFISIFTVGYVVELLGTKTEFPFGNYTYGETLGIKLVGVPLIIGLNWAVLVFSIASTIHKTWNSIWLKCLAGGLLMVLFDLLLEPVAVKLGYWQWNSEIIPIQNYLSWFIISFLLFFIAFKSTVNLNNKIGIWVYIIQFLFLSCLIILK